MMQYCHLIPMAPILEEKEVSAEAVELQCRRLWKFRNLRLPGTGLWWTERTDPFPGRDKFRRWKRNRRADPSSFRNFPDLAPVRNQNRPWPIRPTGAFRPSGWPGVGAGGRSTMTGSVSGTCPGFRQFRLRSRYRATQGSTTRLHLAIKQVNRYKCKCQGN